MKDDFDLDNEEIKEEELDTFAEDEGTDDTFFLDDEDDDDDDDDDEEDEEDEEDED